MEAIKFSELPSGDRMPLADEDGVPMIANQENRLLTWGRLKKQLADQTHTDEVKPDDTKVPTSAAVENRIAAAEDDLQAKLEPITAQLTEQGAAINSATATAQEAKATAEAASSAATSAQSAADAAQTTAESAASTASSAQSAIAEATSSISAVSERVANIETKIENGEIGGAEEVDLTPITERLGAIESEDTAQDERLDALEAKDTTHESAISEAKAIANTAKEALNDLETQKADKTINIAEGMTIDITLDDFGKWTGESYGYSPIENQTMGIEAALNKLFLNQKKLFAMILYLYSHQSTYNNDITKIMNNITTTLNNVVK